MTNFFVSSTTAKRYARARPHLSPLFNERLRERIGPVQSALDLGCGTGMSSRALAEIASLVVGLDASRAMLVEAESHSAVCYSAGVAERLPFEDAAFDLLGAGLAIYWFDRQSFLSEAARVLRPGGWLFTYNTWFCGTMLDDPAFAAWWRGRYLARFPTPTRQSGPITPEQAAAHGFVPVDNWTIEQNVGMTVGHLAEYLATQSNVTAALSRTRETLESVTAWLEEELVGVFIQPVEQFPFAGSASLLSRRTP